MRSGSAKYSALLCALAIYQLHTLITEDPKITLAEIGSWNDTTPGLEQSRFLQVLNGCGSPLSGEFLKFGF